MPPVSSLIELFPEDWSRLLETWGEPRYRARQIFRWIHQRGVMDAEEMTDLPLPLRRRLATEGLSSPVTLATTFASPDGTQKLLFALEDQANIESVLIPPFANDEATPDGWVTQCVSSQVGCALGCVFCASGVAGFGRHLSASEIVAEVLLARQQLQQGQTLRRLVFMGMGEPLHNYDALVRALRLLMHKDGLAFSPRRITVSTSGLVPEIERFGREFSGQVQLAVSLHAPTDALRTELMPINKRYGIKALTDALKRYPLSKRSRFTIEYILIKGVNDTPAHAEQLARILRGLPVKINLIPMNSIASSSHRAPPEETVDQFQTRLTSFHLSTFVRKQRGDDISAACGQLALLGTKPKKRPASSPANAWTTALANH
ncbi:MAG: 23S rRNA (adenine(2503)-C(2))-methyltransferase RlmN [Myxococcales bacterium]|nr:23S rRNA (adenine(2503)-C(2))-methyltransferase RlmN [Myxococcales bacterium]